MTVSDGRTDGRAGKVERSTISPTTDIGDRNHYHHEVVEGPPPYTGGRWGCTIYFSMKDSHHINMESQYGSTVQAQHGNGSTVLFLNKSQAFFSQPTEPCAVAVSVYTFSNFGLPFEDDGSGITGSIRPIQTSEKLFKWHYICIYGVYCTHQLGISVINFRVELNIIINLVILVKQRKHDTIYRI